MAELTRDQKAQLYENMIYQWDRIQNDISQVNQVNQTPAEEKQVWELRRKQIELEQKLEELMRSV